MSATDFDDVLETAISALSSGADDALTKASEAGLPERRDVVDWLRCVVSLVLSERDPGALRITVPDVAERLAGLLERTSLPDGVSAESVVSGFVAGLASVRERLSEDVEAAFDGDPAARSFAEIVVSYPALRAISIYRVAHSLSRLGVPILPRMMTEHAHELTGIDIHPGATIGRRFFIDHGTGVVIGETTEIGDNVRLYQGVTLGAKALRNSDALRGRKRHPTIEDDVTIYSGATILGGGTTIGRGSVVGGNVWLIESVPPGSKVLAEPARQGVHKNPSDDDSLTLPMKWDI